MSNFKFIAFETSNVLLNHVGYNIISFDYTISIGTYYFCYILRREYKKILERDPHLVFFDYSCFHVCDFAIGNRTVRIV